MNKGEIWEVLECCMLATDGADMQYFEDRGFTPHLSRMGLQLCEYLKGKEIEVKYD